MNQQPKLIPLTYLGPIQLFAHLNEGDKVIIEQHCFYERKSFRNRFNIVAANGPIALSIPVVNQKNVKVLTKDAIISYDTDWQKQHWRSIESAYNSSPFFEYYADDFADFYYNRYDSLVDFNMKLFQTVLNALELNLSVSLSDHYYQETENYEDLRSTIYPKRKTNEDRKFIHTEYWQVFKEKHGFIPNMSILDLIFNMGPEANIVLAKSFKS